MHRKRDIWRKFKFWSPIVTGLVTSGAFAIKFLFDYEVPEVVLTWVIIAGLNILAAMLGVDWSEMENKVDK